MAKMHMLDAEIKVVKCQRKKQLLLDVLSKIRQTTQSNNRKLDQLLAAVNKFENSQSSLTEDTNFLASLPCSYEEFLKLNEKILESSSFRENLVQILMTTGGRDGKGMAMSCLRKLITDDAAEKFSLTGKHTNQVKEAFEKTQIYKIIIDAYVRLHKNVQESTLREAISDWLMQAKFRKSRREKRKQPEDTNEVDELS